jgi:hypothetical protein
MDGAGFRRTVRPLIANPSEPAVAGPPPFESLRARPLKKLLIATGALATCAASLVGWQVHAETNRVQFPELDELVHYTTVRRGNVVEHIMTTPRGHRGRQERSAYPGGHAFRPCRSSRRLNSIAISSCRRAKALVPSMTKAAAPPTGNSSTYVGGYRDFTL